MDQDKPVGPVGSPKRKEHNRSQQNDRRSQRDPGTAPATSESPGFESSARLIDVTHCPRCGQSHAGVLAVPMEPMVMEVKDEVYTHHIFCPEKNAPVVLNFDNGEIR